jgi:hypothetical protein
VVHPVPARRRAAAGSAIRAAAAAELDDAIKRSILSLILFGIAFGYLEAAVVVYLRELSAPIRAQAGLGPNDLFPLVKAGQLGPHLRLVQIEVGREAATIIMLAAAALAAAGTPRKWLAAFAVAFGVWDLTFYAALKLLIGWPESLFTWDLLFLVPVPWIGPVISPVIVAASLTAGGILVLIRREAREGWLPWALVITGGMIILVAFMWDWRHIAHGGMPREFPWGVFAVGEILGVGGTLFSLSRAR